MERILQLARRLRDPGGCPWDGQQTLATAAKCLRDEVQELSEAVDRMDGPHIREEIGDCLWNLCFLIFLAEEKGLFTRDEPVMAVLEKMVRRHPHVFGSEKAATAEEALAAFNRAKQREKPEPQRRKDAENKNNTS